ncbi:Conserved oligomeric Golgi complex subunit 8-like protein [Cladobotryum mycophilum]|uniref:Conserved oligomeric Golgi complex subunit 8 n=1 Tax=Cladobotryum mycophilum TaxID=491253 RepID=A0ABR0S6I5_9HYPO
MAEALRDLLGTGQQNDAATLDYVAYLAEQPVDFLQSSEPHILAQRSHSVLLSIQGLSKKSHKLIVDSAAKHASLRDTLPNLACRATELKRSVPQLDSKVDYFSSNFSKLGESKAVARRKQALKLLENADRLVDLMQVPPLLVSAINATPLGYASTLDLHAHVRRLGALYPDSQLISSVLDEADTAIHQLAGELINALKATGLKLAAAIRTVGWLKRIIPDLASGIFVDDALPAIFLVCRMVIFLETLSALEPLRQLADEERIRQAKASQSWSGGQQTERYLKRFIEVFREHSFSIVSISKSVGASLTNPSDNGSDDLCPLPSALSTFPLQLIDLLLETLRIYLPAVKDQASRESILTQVLYCAGSLGRLGADFGILLASIGVDEWVDLVKRHRLLAGRLESVIGDYRNA